MKIRKAAASDIDHLLTIQSACGLSPWTRDGYLDEITRHDSVILVAEDEGAPLIGFLTGRFYPGAGSTAGEAELNNIGVLPSHQRCGVGSALLKDFLERVGNEGRVTITLEVRESNGRAREFYSKHGFIVAGTRRAFYREPVEDALIMSLTLPDRTL